MLYNLKDIIRLVDKEDRGIAAFNVFGYEDSQAVIEAAESIGRPVIIMANKDAVNHMGVELIGEIMLHVGAQAKVPVDVHLDHATDMEVIERAIRSGYTSVMFDGSQLPFDENVERTRHVVEMAHAMDISVEAEIGAVGYSDPDIRFNDRKQQDSRHPVFHGLGYRIPLPFLVLGGIEKQDAVSLHGCLFFYGIQHIGKKRIEPV